MKKLKSRGAAAVEYGMLIGLVALASITMVYSTGEQVEEAICTPAAELADKMGKEKNERCIYDPQAEIDLKDGERFVDAPIILNGDFQDIMFEQGETGERVVLTSLSEISAQEFWVDAAIASRDPYEGSRDVSACYALEVGIDPICATPGETSAVAVPGGARAFGYAVTLNDRTDMPWGNDVNISTPGNTTVAAGNWTVDVARADPEPAVDPVTFAFTTPYSYAQSDTGWTFGEFVNLEGMSNQNLQFSMTDLGGPNRSRKLCYKATEMSDAVCTNAAGNSATITLTVPPGVAQIGYETFLPDQVKGADWEVAERARLTHGSTELHQQDITIVRPNEPKRYGTMAESFRDWTYAQTDTGWTEGQFITLEGERNMPIEIRITGKNGNVWRQACYKLVAGGEAICGDQKSSGSYRDSTAEVIVPLEAVEIGYKFLLPDQYLGNDWTHEDRIYAQGVSATYTTFTVTRPNEPKTYGGMAESFGDYTYAKTDTGLTEGQFIALTGERNSEFEVSITGNNGNVLRQACYKLVAGGEAICGDLKSSGSYRDYTAKVIVPLEAVEIGYKFALPDQYYGNDWTHEDRIYAQGASAAYMTFTVTRPNDPKTYGGMAESFGDYTYAKTDTGWTEGQFIALTGERNSEFEVRISGRDGNVLRQACYKLVAGGEAICGDQKSSGNYRDYSAEVIVPLEAVEIGYKFALPDQYYGDDWIHEDTIYVQNIAGTTTFRVTRPNDPKTYGGMAESFGDYTYAKTDTGWTEGQFIALTGERNSEFEVRISGREDNVLRQACYKLVAGGDAICGDQKSSGDYRNYSASVNVPLEAVEIGYKFALPDQYYGDDWTHVDTIYVQNIAGTTTFTVTRPNDPKQYGTLAESFGDFTFAQSDTGWTEGQFVELTGERNSEMDLRLIGRNGSFYRKACYKLVAGGEAICGDQKRSSDSNYIAFIEVPLEAVEVGYMVLLPETTTETDYTLSDRIGIAEMANNTDISMTRPGTPPAP
jgi:Flp pilus assembly pilin Flp